jgi:dipeptidyl-peptidase-4
MSRAFLITLCSILLLFQYPTYAQTPYTPDKLTADDYEQAEYALSQHTSDLVLGGSVRPNWIDDHRFWYRNQFEEGHEFILVDAKNNTRKRAFDHNMLARALSAAAKSKFAPFKLPFRTIDLNPDANTMDFTVGAKNYTYNLQNSRLTIKTAENRLGRAFFVSPDGQKAAFIKEHNLWVRNLNSGEDTQLTTDGVEDFGYATNNAGWLRSDRPVLLWSPDSKKLTTFQHDGRGVGEMHLATTNVGHPKLDSWKYPLPEDSVIFRVHRVVIHLDGPKLVRLDMEPDQHRSSITDHIALRDGTLADAEWSSDGSMLAFLSNSRDHKEAILRVADPNTGEVRTVMDEKVETFFESGYRMSNWHILPERNEVIWFSQRSDWGHLYLYDLETGELKQPITEGDWNVLQVRKIDREAGKIYFTGAGKEAGDPYFQYFYSVNLDGSELKLLTPDSSNHEISLSPDGSYFVDSYSTPATPPISVLRDKNGGKLLTLEEADISRLVEKGWQAPIPIIVKARDGETDLYGLMYKPKNFDPDYKYPIINYIYPGPQTGSVGSRSFSSSRRDNQAIADLGFIVVAIDAMGTPMRSKSFHAAYYGNMGDNGLPDQIAGMKQLAERHPWIDLDRAGIYGHSGGGFASTAAILRYPDFFKVAVSGAGNHDNRNYEDDWGEKWQGLLTVNPDGSTSYDNQANQLQAKNLKGKLLLGHGTMDTNVPVYNTLLVADALIAANKDFDLIMMPNRGHGFGNEPFWMRKRWDYFVKNLLGAEPPKEYVFQFTRVRP